MNLTQSKSKCGSVASALKSHRLYCECFVSFLFAGSKRLFCVFLLKNKRVAAFFKALLSSVERFTVKGKTMAAHNMTQIKAQKWKSAKKVKVFLGSVVQENLPKGLFFSVSQQERSRFQILLTISSQRLHRNKARCFLFYSTHRSCLIVAQSEP